MAEKEFMLLRQYCLEVVESPSRNNINALSNALNEINSDALQKMQEYVAIPLFETLRARERKEELVVDTVCCMQKLLSLTSVTNWKLFSQIAFHNTMLVSSRDETDTASVSLSDVSDELLVAVTRCMAELFRKAELSVLEAAYSSRFLPQLGHVIYVLLKIIEHQRSRDVKCSAMECLETIGCLHRNVKLRMQIGNCVAHFLPGITMVLTKVATGSGLAGQVITVTALKVWQELVCIVLEDEQLQNSEPCLLTLNDVQNAAHQLKIIKRDAQWMKTTAEKLAILIGKLSVLDSHSSWRVRMALAEFAHTLLTKCRYSLQSATSTLIGILITLCCDDFGAVSNKCKTSLDAVGRLLTKDERPLVEVLQESVLTLLLELPHAMRHSDDVNKLSTINKLHGYLAVLGPMVNAVLNSSSHLEKLSLTLMQLTEIDCGNVQLVAERKSNASCALDELEEVNPHVPQKHFRHFRDDRIHTKVVEICHLFGKYGDLQLLSDHFIEKFHKSVVYRKEATLLFSYMIRGTEFRSEFEDEAFQEELFQILSYVVEEFIEPSVWCVPVALEDETDPNSERHSTAISFAGLNSNILQICLLLEGLGVCIQILKAKFRPLLVRVLYEVLEKVGSSNFVISQTAFATLSRIANHCCYSSVSDVLVENADYLLNSLSLKLRYKPLDCNGPLVLSVALEHSDRRMLYLIGDVVKEAFLGLDTHYSDRSLPYLKVLLSLVNAIKRWFPAPHVDTYPVVSEEQTFSNSSVKDFIVEYHRLKQVAGGIDAVDSSASDRNAFVDDQNSGRVDAINSSSITDSDNKRESPKHVQLVVEVLDRCCHHLPSKNLTVCLLVLDILNVSVEILQPHEDDLLPMVHKTWSPLVQRFNDDNLLTVKKAFQTMCVISKSCSSFVRSRMIKEIWPKLVTFLEKHDTVSLNKGTAFHFTAAYKFLLDVLSNIGDLAIILHVPELEVDSLVSAAIMYLNKHQPTAIQQATLKLIETLYNWVPDLLWLKLQDLYCTDPHYHHDCPTFIDVQLGGNYLGCEDFSKNVTHLIDKLYR